jgi:hypothetical protein
MNNKVSFKTLAKINEVFGDFQIGQVHGGGNAVYLRFGYWNRVDNEKLNEILSYEADSVEDEWFDDDCGWQYNYKLV